MRNKEEEMQNRFSWFRFGIVIILVALLICPVAMLLSYICDKVDPIVGLTISPILLSVCFTFLFYKLLKSEKAFQTIDLSKSERWIAYLEKQKEPHYTKRNELFDKCVENCGPEIMKEVSDVIDKELQKEQKPVPKFSVGDYIKDTNYKGEPLYQIVGIDKECYICEYRGDKEMGDRAVMHFTFDNPYLRLEQKPAGWSEEDEKILNELLDHCNTENAIWYNWLKFLRRFLCGRPMISDNWKPSEEQMKNLEGAYKCELSAGLHTRAGILLTLYNDLKKLM